MILADATHSLVSASEAAGAIDWRTQWPGATLEGVLALAGIAVLWRAWVRRRRWLARSAPPWPGTFLDAALFVAVLIVGIVLVRALAGVVIRVGHIGTGPALLLFGVLTFEGALLLVIALFHFGYLRLKLNAPAPSRGFGAVVQQGAGVFLATVPLVVFLLGWLWETVLTGCGYPVTHQTLVDFFMGIESWWARAVFFAFAVVIAPITEEIIFRGIIYRGLTKVVPRGWAVLLSALLFGAAHGDFSTLLPLVALGALFALAYDATGCIAVTIIAHALFNLNTLVALMLGVGS